MLAATGVIWAAVYMLWMLQRVLFGGDVSEKNARLSDLNAREIGLLIPLLVLMLYMGAYPRPFLEPLARERRTGARTRRRVRQRRNFCRRWQCERQVTAAQLNQNGRLEHAPEFVL